MAEVHNGAMISSKAVSTPRTWRPDAYTLWAVLFGILFIAAVAAIVVTASQGLTTTALIIALFTAAFFSRVGC
ncbi:MAG: hypothetical protein QOH60_1709 [Mycobacterium sp.]|jgi:uncharacterized membrane protein|nr:hypothetical protein [Mycobacterium sp.]